MIGPLLLPLAASARLRRKSSKCFRDTASTAKPFAGGAQVFFRKEPSKIEVLNDLDGEMVNFFRVCQQHYEELVRYLRALCS